MKRTAFFSILSIASAVTLLSCDVLARNVPTLAAEKKERDEIRALFATPYAISDANEWLWLREAAEAQELHIRWEVLSAEDWRAQKAARLEGDSPPDIFINAVDDADFARYPDFFENLAQYVGYFTPNISKMFRENRDIARAAMMYSGELFALPSYSSLELHQLYSHSTKTVMFINQNWLNRLDLAIPDTFEEFEATLRAFREADCNGDGESTDEIPFDFYGWDGAQTSAVMLLGCFGLQLTDGGKDGYFMENNAVQNFFTDGRYKYLLRHLAVWYREGLIRDASLTSSYEDFVSRSHGGSDGAVFVGCTIAAEETEQFGEKNASRYRVMLPPVSEWQAEESRRYWSADNLAIKTNAVAMSASCPQKDRVIAFIDSIYATDNSVKSFFGGDEFFEKSGEMSFRVKTNLRKEKSFGEAGPHFLENALGVVLSDNYVYAQLERTAYQKLAVKEGSFYPEIFLKYPLSQLKALSDMQQNINSIAHDFALRVIRGEADLEAEWASYCRALDEAGLSSATRARQAAYDRYASK